MRCRLGDMVMVIRSECGNEGKVGNITARETLGEAPAWVVEGNVFRMRIDAPFPTPEFESPLAIFPDSWLLPLRDPEEDDQDELDEERFDLLETSL